MTPETRGSSFSSSSSCLPSSSCLSFDGVVEAVNAGLKAGQTQFGIGAKSILCCMRGDEGAKWASIVAEVGLVPNYVDWYDWRQFVKASLSLGQTCVGCCSECTLFFRNSVTGLLKQNVDCITR